MPYFLIAEEGTKEGDDSGVPSSMNQGKTMAKRACGLAAWAVRDQARPACGYAWSSDARRVS